ncbi:MAG: glycosyltransferase family 4 protein [Candidatus Odinarchaeota archaeon]|nr:glycosyltransferase family 4 protein [Candidatus Odinarchaeota archaeon]
MGCIHIPTINIMALRRYYSLLNDILRINSFDLIHAHHAFTPTSLFSIEIASKLKIPSVLTAHSLSYGYTNKKLWSIASKFMKPIKEYYTHVNKIIAVSNAVKDFMLLLYDDEEKITVIPNGINTKEYYPFIKRKELFRDELNLNHDEINFLFVGRLVLRKGLHILIEGFKILLKELPNVRLFIIGDGYLKYWLLQIISQNDLKNKVNYLGKLNDEEKKKYLVASDVLVVPSIDAEAFGIVTLEGFATATPVIGTRVGGLSEIIEHGRNGILVDPSNPYSLATAMYHLAIDDKLRKRLGKNGLQDAKKKYDWKVIIKKIIGVYDAIVNS